MLRRGKESRADRRTADKLLRRDFASKNGWEAGAEELLSAALLLENHAVSTEEAWARFQGKYLPFLTDGRSLYEDEEELTEMRVQGPSSTRKRWKRSLLKATCAAAALVAVMLTAATAAAAGYDLWGGLFKRTKDTFRFTQVPYASEVTYPDKKDFADLQEAVEAYGFTQRVLPRWLPEGFEQQLLYADDNSNPHALIFQAFYQKGGECLIIGCDTVLDQEMASGNSTSFQTDEEDPEVYEINGQPYFLMTNAGRPVALWTDGTLECYVTGDITQDELIRMIDSLYEG